MEKKMQCINCGNEEFVIIKKENVFWIKCDRCNFDFPALKIEQEYVTEKYQPEGFDPWNPEPILFIGEGDSKIALL